MNMEGSTAPFIHQSPALSSSDRGAQLQSAAECKGPKHGAAIRQAVPTQGANQQGGGGQPKWSIVMDVGSGDPEGVVA